MKQYFITGTDTDCGKTYVTCQLVKEFQNKGYQALAIKPVASGCTEQDDGTLLNNDVQLLEQVNGRFDSNICSWLFEPPIAPHLAAGLANIRLSSKAIVDFCNAKPFAQQDYVLIEGAGGLMVPLNEQETWLDFLKMSEIPVILVVGIRLGCINHALLTAQVLKAHQIVCEGWIANCIDGDMLMRQDNIDTIASRIGLPLLMTVPYQGIDLSREL